METHDLIYPPEAEHDAKVIFAGEYDIPLKRPPVSVLDIGANVGLFTVWAAKQWPGTCITAFEPWPQNFNDLMRNAAGIPEVTSLQMAAVGSKKGNAFMRAGRNRMCGSFMPDNKQGEAKPIRVEAASELGGSWEFVKIDVEGHEVEILDHLDLSKTRAVAVEAHDELKREAVCSIMSERGFTLFVSRPSVNGCTLLKFVRDMAELRTPKAVSKNVFIGLPVYGGYHPHFVHSLIPLLMSPPCSLKIGPCVGDSLVARARNKIVADFLATDCTHLLFLDTDLIFSVQAIARLLSHDVAIVGGLYPKKQRALAWVCNMLPESQPDANGLQRVKYIGTGAMLIRRDVIELMIRRHPEIAYQTDRGQEQRIEHDVFPCAPMFDPEHGQTRYHSEDWGFCRRALNLGIDVHADTCVVMKHVGDCIYPLDDPFEPADFDTASEPKMQCHE